MRGKEKKEASNSFTNKMRQDSDETDAGIETTKREK